MAKRVAVNLMRGFDKRRKLETPANGEVKVSIGHSSNLTAREVKLFDAIVNLVTKEKEVPVICNMSNLPSKDGSSLFMEFDIEKEDLNLWLKTSGLYMKFLLHPVYTIGALETPVKHPLISFSRNFVDSENWRLAKSALSEIFGERSNDAESPDYVYTFSRRGHFIHLRVYKVLSLPDSSTQQKKWELSGLCGHICFLPVSFPPKGMNQVKVSETIDLAEDIVFVGTQSSLLHAARFRGFDIYFALDDPIDLSSWYGFSTCLTDFRERNKIMLSGRLLGSIPPFGDFVNDKYKRIIRSLLIRMHILHQMDLCFYKLDESDICLSDTTVHLSWNLTLMDYDTAPARLNHRSVRDIILTMFSGVVMPPDMVALVELLSCEHLTPGEYLCNHSSLMDDISKGHMVVDIHFEFSTTLSFRNKLIVAQPLFHYLQKWRQAFQSNELLKGILEHKYGDSESHEETVADEAVELPSGGTSYDIDIAAIDDEYSRNLAIVREVSVLVSKLRHGRMHIADQLKKLHKVSGPKREVKRLQLQESMRIITSVVPEVLHILQNELRNFFGDKWFAKYFTHQ